MMTLINKPELERRCISLLRSLCALVWVASIGCGDPPHSHEGHDHSDEGAGHGHLHVAPHGGAAVVLGDELYHLEFLIDPEASLLDCYVLDGHMEEFVRIKANSVPVTLEDGTELELQAVASRVTGESVGDTSHFQTTLSVAENRDRFSATVKAITIKGNRFENIPFRYPEGNESGE